MVSQLVWLGIEPLLALMTRLLVTGLTYGFCHTGHPLVRGGGSVICWKFVFVTVFKYCYVQLYINCLNLSKEEVCSEICKLNYILSKEEFPQPMDKILSNILSSRLTPHVDKTIDHHWGLWCNWSATYIVHHQILENKWQQVFTGE